MTIYYVKTHPDAKYGQYASLVADCETELPPGRKLYSGAILTAPKFEVFLDVGMLDAPPENLDTYQRFFTMDEAQTYATDQYYGLNPSIPDPRKSAARPSESTPR
ncbi:MAG: hypothetical protein SFW62_01715 [Alphaproteobacteria bacterium]|nr:hypothetical protein [Alphaproteobacteria bacterium]